VAKNTYYSFKNLGLRSSLLALASCLALSGVPQVAEAAGLGKVTILSALGQPLRAEVEVFATREELAGMRVQLASVDAFRQAGLDYATTLLSIKFTLDKRASGQSIIKLSSDKPINDPFIDMLLELNWTSGRLLREYTFLLDPPELLAKTAAAVEPAFAKPLAANKLLATAEIRAASPLDDKLLAQSAALASPRPRVQQGEKDTAESEPATHAVKRGETLRQIANEVKADNVSLDQMLVALLRANPGAFDGGNINRLKAGKILSVPEKSAVEAIAVGEAKKIVVAQSANWNAYRSKLAAVAEQAPVKEEASKQNASGKVTPKVDDKAAPALVPKDQLKVSKPDAQAAASAKRSEEELIAKEKTIKEANSRLASLEKNVADLQKLVELKNQSLAELQKQAAAKTLAPPSPSAPMPVEVKKPEPEVKPQPVPPPAPLAALPLAIEPAEPVLAPSAPAVIESTEEKEPEAKLVPPPIPKAQPKPAPIPVEETPPQSEMLDWVEALLDNPMILVGGGGIVALSAIYLLLKRRRRQPKNTLPLVADTRLPAAGSLTANSIFRNAGGHSVDTAKVSAMTADFSQAGPGSIDTDEVDPVAEADVYMAYGRDAQAEEILLEAKQKDPKRYAIYLKLLEIYANRKSVKQFETMASELYNETAGAGPDWAKAVEMGLSLDPKNPLFGGASPAPQPFDADATVIVQAQPNLGNTVVMPGQLSQLAVAAGAAVPLSSPPALASNKPPVSAAAVPVPAASVNLVSLDFDLGTEAGSASADVANPILENTQVAPAAAANKGVLDFDIDTARAESAKPQKGVDFSTATDLDFNLPDFSAGQPMAAASTSPTEELGAALDFGLAVGATPAMQPEPLVADIQIDMPSQPSSSAAAAANKNVLDFDVGTNDLPASEPAAAPASKAPSFDMMSINLDLGDAPTAASDFSRRHTETVVNSNFIAEAEFESAAEFDISPDQEVATKLDLAKAYQEMGDVEGARELLQEVLKDGGATQQQRAQTMLSSLGA
jgi:pilus assembly protein FimV